MTIPTSTNSDVKLYAHDPSSLIPLLKKHQPRSLPVLSTILENLTTRTQNQTSSGSKQSCDDTVWTTFPPLLEHSGDILAKAKVIDVDEEGVWAVIVRLPDLDTPHLRFYCSAESQYSNHEDEDMERIQGFIRGITESIVGIYGKEIMVGAVSSLWTEEMRRVVDSRELVECSVFLAPPTPTLGADTLDRGRGDQENGDEDDDEKTLAGMALKLDRARDEDIAMIQSTCDVPRPLSYYTSRSSQSSVIRHTKTQEAVCWIILHADGSLGALYTLPTWRRKGLAEIVVRQNIKFRHSHCHSSSSSALQGSDTRDKGQEEERRDFCYVFKGNTASEGLWVKMGWEEGWGVRWIVNRKVEEVRGKVERFTHPDEER